MVAVMVPLSGFCRQLVEICTYYAISAVSTVLSLQSLPLHFLWRHNAFQCPTIAGCTLGGFQRLHLVACGQPSDAATISLSSLLLPDIKYFGLGLSVPNDRQG